jgi:hypothetical protein
MITQPVQINSEKRAKIAFVGMMYDNHESLLIINRHTKYQTADLINIGHQYKPLYIVVF